MSGRYDTLGRRADKKRGPRPIPLIERFWLKMTLGPVSVYCPDLGPCWIWLAFRDRDGFGFISVSRSKMRRAHHVAYENFIGPIPDGLQLDHLCRVRYCVNPYHLDAVTTQENTRRGARSMRTHCPSGHPFDDINTYWYRGYRLCIRCRLEQARQYQVRKRTASGTADQD